MDLLIERVGLAMRMAPRLFKLTRWVELIRLGGVATCNLID